MHWIFILSIFFLFLWLGVLLKRKAFFWGMAMLALVFLFTEIVSRILIGAELRKTGGFGNIYLVGNGSLLEDRLYRRVSEMVQRMTFRPDAYRFDPELGFVTAALQGDGTDRQTNSFGMRTDREYPLLSSPDKLRVACFGDSFFYCDGERSQDCWTYYLEDSVGNLEVLNFGVSYNGLGQSFLRLLKDGLRYDPDIVIFNYVAAGGRDRYMVERILEGIPLYYTEFAKVDFDLSDDGVLSSRRMTPLDVFDPEFREERIYRSVGLSEKTSFWSWPVFTRTYTGLLIKSRLAPGYYAKRMKKRPDYDERLTGVFLFNLLELARRFDFQVVFLDDWGLQGQPRTVQEMLR
ncbi:MAG: SGNH/GDSL hydrolase family protein, partial [Elusimicrobia bacterium]|nr:SGNH/GDSL hydrolase family protein [Elusimicrobiota bacterium]